ncbi:MFS transporter [Streptomyces bambusae]|uniref:MFS transporter n=1 Tax=Streptomyces bambusae TaxID=1550616 RepID=UPI001CFE0692|nr:MFS transporter [Streptomyces bambusae]MCB5165219.1 MFS transporter [Streptomyces bambusae]
MSTTSTRAAALRARIPGGPDGRRVLVISLVDKIGTGLWAGTAVLYFSTVAGLGLAQVGLLIAVSGGIGIAGAPLAGRAADSIPVTRLSACLHLVRAAAALALLTTHDFWLLLAYSAVGSLGDRGANVTTKLYAARIAGPDRVRFQALNRTVMNIGFGIGGLAAAGALALGTTGAYRALLLGDALSYLAMAALTLRCTETAAPGKVVTGSGDPAGPPAARPASPWRDRTYLLYTLTETALFFDDAIFKVGIPLWIIHATEAPHGLAPLLMVLNNVLVVLCQVPLARYGTSTDAARRLLRPLAASFGLGCAALAAAALGGPWTATAALVVAAAALTFAEMVHAVASWELSLALAPDEAQGAYLGVHGLAAAGQRSLGPLAATAAVAAGPLAWAALGAALALTCLGQDRLVRTALPGPALSVPPITVRNN